MHWSWYHWKGYVKRTLQIWSLLWPWARFSWILISWRLGQYKSFRNEEKSLWKYWRHCCGNKNRHSNWYFPKKPKISKNQFRSWYSWIYPWSLRKFRNHYWSHHQAQKYPWIQSLWVNHFPWFWNRNQIYVRR